VAEHPGIRDWDDARPAADVFETRTTFGFQHIPTRPWWVIAPTWWKPWTWHLALYRRQRKGRIACPPSLAELAEASEATMRAFRDFRDTGPSE
jgi:hypothetical protein